MKLKLTASLLLILGMFAGKSLAQQPQTQTAPLYAVNAKYVNGVAPGYSPTVNSGLILNIGPGTSVCNGTVQNYAGGTLTLTASTTNYIYLDTSNGCTPTVSTSGFISSLPVAMVNTGSSAINSIADVRTPFNNSNGGGVSAPGVAYAALEPGADAGQKIQNAINAVSPNGIVITRGLSGNINTPMVITQPISIDCSGSTLTFTGPDQGVTAGVITIETNNFYLYGGTNSNVCTLARGINSNIQTLIMINAPSQYITFHDLYINGNGHFSNGNPSQTCPELTCFYSEIRSDPTAPGTSDLRLWNLTFENGIDRPLDLRSANNVWWTNSKVEHCDTINNNFGCEAGSIDEAGKYLPGIGGATISNGGSGYPLTGATLTFSAPPVGGTQATGTPIIQNGVPVNLTLTSTSHNFTGPPWVKISDSTGKGTMASATISGQVTAITVMTGGTFTGSPAGTITWNAEPGSGAVVGTVFSGGGLQSCSVTSGGSGYLPGQVGFQANSATGTGGFATLTVTGGAISSCTVVNNGENYANTDTGSVYQIGGTGASCTALFSGSALTGCSGSITPGDGYYSSQTSFQLSLSSGTEVVAPTLTGNITFYVKSIQFTAITGGYTSPTCTIGGGGSPTIPPATCTVSVANGVWTGTTMTNNGTGYYVAGYAAPTVTLSAGSGTGGAATPNQQIQLNPTTNVFESHILISDYSDSSAMGRCIGCHLDHITMLGRPYWGETPRPTSGGFDMADCINCSADSITILGANGPQFALIGFDIVGVTTVMPYHDTLTNFIFDPTATAIGVTPVDISAFDQELEIGADSQPSTCQDIKVSDGHLKGVRINISNCDTVSITNVKIQDINPLGGINAAIILSPIAFIAEPLTTVILTDDIFETTNSSIVYAVQYQAGLIGNAPYVQRDNQYNNGIIAVEDQTGTIGASVDYQDTWIKQATGYAQVPVFRFRCSVGTQAFPAQLTNGSNCGILDFGYYSTGGDGPSYSNDGYIPGVRITSSQITAPVGNVMSAALIFQVQDPGATGNLVPAMILEPNSIVSEYLHTFVQGISIGVSGPTWTTGTVPPTGSCVIGSLYSNTAGTSGNVLYDCLSTGWININ